MRARPLSHFAVLQADNISQSARASFVSHWAADSAATVKQNTHAASSTAHDKSLGHAEALPLDAGVDRYGWGRAIAGLGVLFSHSR